MEVCEHNHITINAKTAYHVDPTRTTGLRNSFARDMKKRFMEIEIAIAKAVNVQDVFGLKRQPVVLARIPNLEEFAFERSEAKLAAFMKWLQEQVDRGVLDIRDLEQVGKGIEGAWTNKYIFDSYKRGIIRGRQELKKAGLDIPSIEESGGIFVIMGLPMHVDRLGLLYTRVYSDLKGITDAMDAQISRILAQGIADGDNPRLLAKKLVSTINGSGMRDLGITDSLGRFIPAERRAEMLARTEVIRAHHLATIQEYRNWGVEGVYVKAEWRTAGDNRVCPICESHQGEIYTLDEIEKMIPAHPFCRCMALPFLQSQVVKKGTNII